MTSIICDKSHCSNAIGVSNYVQCSMRTSIACGIGMALTLISILDRD